MCSTSQSNHAASSSCGASSTARAAVGRHRPVAGRRERDDDAGPAADRARRPRRRARRAPARRARRPRRRRACRRSARRRRARAPRRRRSPPARPRRCACVAAWSSPGTSGCVEPDDHVEQQVAERGQPHEYDRRMDGDVARGAGFARSRSAGSSAPPGRSRPFAALAPRRAARRDAPGGLAAFEDAPCFLELVGEEAQRYREGGETSTGTSNPT